MDNPGSEKIQIDGTTLILSIIGLLPIVGDIAKDQIQANIHRVEMERIQEAVSRIRERLSSLSARTFTPTQIQLINNLCVTTFQRVRSEGMADKRRIFSDILAETITLSLEPARMDWLQRSVERLSVVSIEVLKAILASSPRSRAQIHSHVGVMTELENKYTYSFLIALLRELESVGIIDIKTDQSSVVGGNARFTVFWKSIGDDFASFIREAR